MYINSFGEVLRWVSFTKLGGPLTPQAQRDCHTITIQRDLVSKNGIPGPCPQIARDDAFAKDAM